MQALIDIFTFWVYAGTPAITVPSVKRMGIQLSTSLHGTVF